MKNNIITTRIAQNRSKALKSAAKQSAIPPKTTKKETESGSYTDASGALLKGDISAEGVYTPGGVTNPDPNQMSDSDWKKFLENETPAEKIARHAREVAEGRRQPGTYSTSTSEDLKPQLTEKQEGTRSDVYKTMEERRYGAGGRMDSIRLRKEKKYGRRQLRQLEKYYKKMGITKDDPRYEAEKIQAFKDMKMGQGPAAQEMYKRMTDPNVARVQQEQQRLKKTPRLSTYTENLQDIQKKQAGGETIMAPEGTETVEAAKARLEGKVKGQLNLGTKNYSDEFKKVGESLSNMPAFTRSITKKNPSAYKSGKIKAAPFRMSGYGSKAYKK